MAALTHVVRVVKEIELLENHKVLIVRAWVYMCCIDRSREPSQPVLSGDWRRFMTEESQRIPGSLLFNAVPKPSPYCSLTT